MPNRTRPSPRRTPDDPAGILPAEPDERFVDGFGSLAPEGSVAYRVGADGLEPLIGSFDLVIAGPPVPLDNLARLRGCITLARFDGDPDLENGGGHLRRVVVVPSEEGLKAALQADGPMLEGDARLVELRVIYETRRSLWPPPRVQQARE